MSKVSLVALVLAGFAAAPLSAQAPATVPLGAATATFADPFTQIGGVRELPGGKVIVVDQRDKVVQLIDMASGSSTKIGREGSGPGEYQFPRFLYAIPNNETLLSDPMQDRLLRIDATGKVVETISAPIGMGMGSGGSGSDAQGRIYWEGSPFGGGGGLTFGGPQGGPMQAADSVPVLRWDRRTNRIDTLLQVKGASMKVNVSGGSNSRSVMVQQQPYSARDAWGVAPDGRVAVARSTPYRIDARNATGQLRAGSAIPATPIRISSADKDDFLKGLRNGVRMTRTVGGGGGGPAPPQPPPPSADDYTWPETKPFFDPASVRMSNSGELWVMRYRPAGDNIPVYDVFDATGKLTRRVSLPAKTRLIGFGDGSVYLARTDDDDLQYLERYRDCTGAACDARTVPLGR